MRDRLRLGLGRNMDVTIEVDEDFMVVEYGQPAGSRLMWKAAGIDIYVKGALNDMDYERAQHLAMIVCDNENIPVSSLRRVTKSAIPSKKSFKTETKVLF